MTSPSAGNHQKCWDTGITGDRSCDALSRFVHCRNCPEYSNLGRTLFARQISDDYRRELSDLLSLPAKTVSEDTLSVVVFRISSEWFAMKTSIFHEIAPAQRIYVLPFRSGATLAGMVNINGELLLCVSLKGALGLASQEAQTDIRPRICVIGTGRERFAFHANEVLGIRRVPRSRLQNGPVTLVKSPSAQTAWSFELDGINVGLIDEKKFFNFLDRSLQW